MTKAILSHASRPANSTGGRFILWARKNLFSSWSNSLLTIVCLWLMWELIPPLLNWAFLQANWVGSTGQTAPKLALAGYLFMSVSVSSCMDCIHMNSAGV